MGQMENKSQLKTKIQQFAAGVSYTPKILRNMNEICEEMGVGPKTVKKWVEQGAPIAVEGEGRNKRYSAEIACLQKWRGQQSLRAHI